MVPKFILPSSEKKYLIIKEVKTTAAFEYKRLKGKSLLNEALPTIIFKRKNAINTDFLVGGVPFLVISERAKRFFEEHIKHSRVEYIQVNVENYSSNSTFWILHPLDTLECFDWKRSIYTLFEDLAPNGKPAIRKVQHMQFDEKRIGKKEIYLSKEFGVRIFISKSLEQKLLETDLIGYEIFEFTSQ